MSGSYGKQTVTQKGKGKKTVSKDKKAEAVVEKLTEQQQISDQLHVKIKNVLKESEAPSPRKTWGAWLTAMLPCLHDNVINGFFRQSFELMMTHVEESNNIRAKEMQQPQQPQQVNETNRPVQQSEIVQSTQQQFSQPQQVYHFGQSPQKQQQQFNQYPQQQVSPTPQIQHPQYHPITGQLISGQYAYQQTQQFVQDTSVMGPIHSATNVLDDDA